MQKKKTATTFFVYFWVPWNADAKFSKISRPRSTEGEKAGAAQVSGMSARPFPRSSPPRRPYGGAPADERHELGDGPHQPQHAQEERDAVHNERNPPAARRILALAEHDASQYV